jgi:MFS family permease
MAADPTRESRRAWAIVAALSVTETVSWGVLYYAFAVFLVPMRRELGWSLAELSGAFSAALLVSAAAGVLVGRWLDRHGPRGLMTAGSIAATALVLAWSRVESLLGFYAIWLGIGAVMAAVLYEPAFTTIAKWFDLRRRRALTTLTLVAALASFVFSPLSGWLVEALGWRPALVVLAAVLGAITVPLHALVLRAPPAPAVEDTRPGEEVAGRDALRSPPFWILTAAFTLGALTTSAMGVHLVSYLVERGHPATFAATAAGLVGLFQIPGRVVLAGAARFVAPRLVVPTVFALGAVAVALLAATTTVAAVLVAVGLLGMSNGMATLARATTVADLYGPARYGALAGVVAAGNTGARAVAPVAAALLLGLAGSWAVVLGALAVCSALAAVAGHEAVRRLDRAG